VGLGICGMFAVLDDARIRYKEMGFGVARRESSDKWLGLSCVLLPAEMRRDVDDDRGGCRK
jgi:hypothetical protein